MKLINTNFAVYQNNITTMWKELFNQATFANYDTVNPLFVNKVRIPPAIVTGGQAYPQQLNISLNVGEINNTQYSIDVRGSTTANYIVLYTQYEDTDGII